MRSTSFFAWLAVFAFLIAVGLGFGVLAKRVATDLSGEAALGWLTFVATTWLAIWTFQKTKRKEAEAQIFPEKAKVYKELIDIIRDVMFAQKGWGPPLDADAIAQRFGRVRYDMIVWGGQETIRAVTAFEESSASGDMGIMFTAAANLYANVRKELGHSDDAQLPEDMFLAQLIPQDREKVRKLMRGPQS